MSVVLISGGTGLIGQNLTAHLTARKYEVIILTRDKEKHSEKAGVSYANWDIKKQTIDESAIARADHIIHLAGAGVMDHRWTDDYKKEILESRTQSSSLLMDALSKISHHVQSFTSASAIGYYGEDPKAGAGRGFVETDPPDNSFLGETCVEWEQSVNPAGDFGLRLCKLRTGIVLSTDGGAYPEFRRPILFGIAGILGRGKQVVSWIHIQDLCRMYVQAIEDERMTGVYNAVAGLPVTNKALTLAIADALRGNFYIPVHVPEFALKLMLGQKSTEVLKSTTVSADKIINEGFTFLYPDIKSAITALAKED